MQSRLQKRMALSTIEVVFATTEACNLRDVMVEHISYMSWGWCKQGIFCFVIIRVLYIYTRTFLFILSINMLM